MGKKLDWFTWRRLENEKDYGDWCEHIDRFVSPQVGHDGKFDITCLSCGAEAEWNGKDYQQELPKRRFNKGGTR